MSITAIIIVCIIIMILAIPFSMTGQGGGTTYLPILLAVGINFHSASATSLFMVMMASFAATLIFGRKSNMDWKLLFTIIPLGIIGSFAGGYFAQFVSAIVLKIVFAIVLIISAFFMIQPTIEGQSPRYIPKWGCWERCCGEYRYSISLGLLIPASGIASFVAGMIGIGGGLFLLPLLMLLFGCPTRIAIGISSTYVGIAALTGFIGHLAGGSDFNIWTALPLASSAFIGATLGPRLSLKTNVSQLRVILSVVLFVLAIWTVFNIFEK
jgi:uncharacterized protein